jgi:hypothetical protein
VYGVSLRRGREEQKTGQTEDAAKDAPGEGKALADNTLAARRCSTDHLLLAHDVYSLDGNHNLKQQKAATQTKDRAFPRKIWLWKARFPLQDRTLSGKKNLVSVVKAMGYKLYS